MVWKMSAAILSLRSALCSGAQGFRSKPPGGAGGRRALSAGGGGDFKIDFSKYFTSPTAKPSDSTATPSTSEPNEAQADAAPPEEDSASSAGDTNSGKPKRGILDILSGGEHKSSSGALSDKFKLDLSKLFISAEKNASISTGEGSVDGPLKPFKLNLSRLKNLSAEQDNVKFADRKFRSDMGRPARPASGNLSDSARREISLQKLGHLSRFGSPQSSGFNILAPKEHMLEKYFSLENMSLSERHKVELMDIREAFKIHDADCGSTPVQIALLSQKIKHLSHHLSQHRKDKHSRRGLVAMIENRRCLMIYLRRKDWATYCYTLSTLGLRDKLDVAKA